MRRHDKKVLSILLHAIGDTIGTLLRLFLHVGLDVEVAEQDDEGDLVADVGLDHPRGEVAVLGVEEVDHLVEGAKKLNHLKWEIISFIIAIRSP